MNTETDKNSDAEWFENFKGKCITCDWATSSPCLRSVRVFLKNQVTCTNPKAITRGIGAKGWGGSPVMQVHKLFGCVYWRKS